MAATFSRNFIINNHYNEHGLNSLQQIAFEETNSTLPRKIPHKDELISALMSKLTPHTFARSVPSMKIPFFPPDSTLNTETALEPLPANQQEFLPISEESKEQQAEPSTILFPSSPSSPSRNFQGPSIPPKRPLEVNKETKGFAPLGNQISVPKKMRVAKDSQKLEWGTTSCHQCHTKKCPEKVIHCTNKHLHNLEEDCKKRYCLTCLERKYGETNQYFKDPEVLKNWVCPHCRGICNCPPCSKKRSGSSSPLHSSPPRSEFTLQEMTPQEQQNQQQHQHKRPQESATTSDPLHSHKKRRVQSQKDDMEEGVSLVLGLWKNSPPIETTRNESSQAKENQQFLSSLPLPISNSSCEIQHKSAFSRRSFFPSSIENSEAHKGGLFAK